MSIVSGVLPQVFIPFRAESHGLCTAPAKAAGSLSAPPLGLLPKTLLNPFTA